MYLNSLSGFTVLFFDFMLSSYVFISVVLSVLNAINKDIGTELDWLVACMFLIIYAVYNYCLSQTVVFHWNRLKEYIYIYAIVVILAIFFVMLFNDSCGSDDNYIEGE